MTDYEFIKENLIDLIDFIRWKELAYLVISFIFWIMILGWFWGIIVTWVLDWLYHLQGGPVFGTYPEPDRKKPCSAGIKDCCGNGYSHEFNVSYEQRLKWWQRMI